VKAEATAAGVETLARAVKHNGGHEAVSLRVAEQYIGAFKEIAKRGNTMLLPADVGNPANMIAQAMAIYKNSDEAFTSEQLGGSDSAYTTQLRDQELLPEDHDAEGENETPAYKPPTVP